VVTLQTYVSQPCGGDAHRPCRAKQNVPLFAWTSQL